MTAIVKTATIILASVATIPAATELIANLSTPLDIFRTGIRNDMSPTRNAVVDAVDIPGMSSNNAVHEVSARVIVILEVKTV